MNDSVQYAFGNCTFFIFSAVTVDPVVPFIGIVLRAKNQSTLPAADFNDLQQVIGF